MSDASTNFDDNLNSQKPNAIEIKSPDGKTSFLNKIEFVEGDNVTITVDPVAKTVEIASTGGGGGGSNTLDYLILTNDALIVQPAVLGSPVSFTRTAEGSETDAIDTGLTLARGANGALYNVESEEGYDNTTHNSPAGAEWNSEGWGDLLALPLRSYGNLRSVLNNYIGENIIGAELVMHDTINDKYYKFSFSDWGVNNGGSFAYTRTEIQPDPNYFVKEDYGDEVDIFVADDPVGTGIGITRGEYQGIYNPYQEEGWNESVSPAGTQWNTDGWSDFSDLESRTYTNFYDALGGNLGENVPGAELVMYLPSEEKYYAIKFRDWTQGNNGGGFSYARYEIDQDEINEGVKFPDGTVLKTAIGVGRIKSTASGDRRIDEVSGSKNVSVTEISTTNLSTTTSRSASGGAIWIDSTDSEIAAIINSPENYDIWDYSTIQFSLDNSTWYTWAGSTSFSGDERGYYLAGANLTYTEGDTVYFRYKTGGEPQVWWDKNDLPGGNSNFRGAIIDYHAFTGEGTFIGTIYIVDDDGEENISHSEVSSGSTDSENDDLWLVQNEGTISYRRIDGEAKTLKIHWTAKAFYGDEFYD